MASTDDVAVGDVVFSFGYPHAPFGSSIMALQEALVGARVLVTKGTLKIRHVVINQQSVLGQSGAPVYSKKTLNLIGILVGVFAVGGGGHMSIGGVDPHTLHQTSYVVSAEYLASMLR